MFNLLQTAGDDQTAIGACLATLAVASFIVFISFHLGPAGQKQKLRNRSATKAALQSQTNVDSEKIRDRAA